MFCGIQPMQSLTFFISLILLTGFPVAGILDNRLCIRSKPSAYNLMLWMEFSTFFCSKVEWAQIPPRYYCTNGTRSLNPAKCHVEVKFLIPFLPQGTWNAVVEGPQFSAAALGESIKSIERGQRQRIFFCVWTRSICGGLGPTLSFSRLKLSHLEIITRAVWRNDGNSLILYMPFYLFDFLMKCESVINYFWPSHN